MAFAERSRSVSTAVPRMFLECLLSFSRSVCGSFLSICGTFPERSQNVPGTFPKRFRSCFWSVYGAVYEAFAARSWSCFWSVPRAVSGAFPAVSRAFPELSPERLRSISRAVSGVFAEWSPERLAPSCLPDLQKSRFVSSRHLLRPSSLTGTWSAGRWSKRL